MLAKLMRLGSMQIICQKNAGVDVIKASEQVLQTRNVRLLGLTTALHLRLSERVLVIHAWHQETCWLNLQNLEERRRWSGFERSIWNPAWHCWCTVIPGTSSWLKIDLVERKLRKRPCWFWIKIALAIYEKKDVIGTAAASSSKTLSFWIALLMVLEDGEDKMEVIITPLNISNNSGLGSCWCKCHCSEERMQMNAHFRYNSIHQTVLIQT